MHRGASLHGGPVCGRPNGLWARKLCVWLLSGWGVQGRDGELGVRNRWRDVWHLRGRPGLQRGEGV